MFQIEKLPTMIPLGNQGEENATTLEFDVSAWLTRYPAAIIGITYLRPDDPPNGPPHPAAGVGTADGITRWTIGAAVLAVAGQGSAVIRCMADGMEVHSALLYTTVAAGHGPAGDVPEPMVDYVGEVLEAGQGAKLDRGAVEALRTDYEGYLADTRQARDEAAGHEQGALALAGIATTKAAEAAASEQVSKDKATQSGQALSDLLAMLGTQVATLGPDGKLTPGQIPAISINDVYPVASTAVMLTLDAQRGDTALVMVDGVVTDSYILATDDPTDPAAWKKLGVSYVANAGHAGTADSATDAQMINGKRIIAMTQAQYDTALASGTIDAETYYIVTP